MYQRVPLVDLGPARGRWPAGFDQTGYLDKIYGDAGDTHALVWCADRIRGGTVLAEHKHDTSLSAMRFLDAYGSNFQDMVRQHLLARRLRPTPARWEIWLGPPGDREFWTHPRIVAQPDRTRVIARDFLATRMHRRRALARYGAAVLLAGLVALGYADPAHPLLVLALPASDAFTDADSTALVTHNAGWALQHSGAGFNVQGNAIAPAGTSGNGYGARWTADAWPDDQYSEGLVDLFSGSGGAVTQLGVGCRIGASNNNSYSLLLANSFGGDGMIFCKQINDSPTNFGTNSDSPVGSTIHLRCEGSTITARKDGSLYSMDVGTNPVTDTQFASGDAGLKGYNTDTGLRLASWEGGEPSGGGGGFQAAWAAHVVNQVLGGRLA